MQLRGARDLVDLLGAEAEAAADRVGEGRDPAEVLVEIRLLLAQRLDQHVAHLLPVALAATSPLLLVQALVGELEGERDVAGLVGKDDRAVGGADREAPAVLREGRRGRGQAIGKVRAHRAQQDAELVAAQTVRLAGALDRARYGTPEAGEERVARGVAEGVVVALEPVEVEEDEDRALPGLLERRLHVQHQAAPVAEAG